MAKIVKKSPAPLYLAAAVWAAWAVLAPLYAWWHFALAAAVSAAAWRGGRKLFPDKVLILPDPEPAPEPEPEPELSELIVFFVVYTLGNTLILKLFVSSVEKTRRPCS